MRWPSVVLVAVVVFLLLLAPALCLVPSAHFFVENIICHQSPVKSSSHNDVRWCQSAVNSQQSERSTYSSSRDMKIVIHYCKLTALQTSAFRKSPSLTISYCWILGKYSFPWCNPMDDPMNNGENVRVKCSQSTERYSNWKDFWSKDWLNRLLDLSHCGCFVCTLPCTQCLFFCTLLVLLITFTYSQTAVLHSFK